MAAARLDQPEGKEANIDFKEAARPGRNQPERKVNRSPDVRNDKSARGRNVAQISLRSVLFPPAFPSFFSPFSSICYRETRYVSRATVSIGKWCENGCSAEVGRQRSRW